MIPRVLRASSDAEDGFVVRLRNASNAANDASANEAVLIESGVNSAVYSCDAGLFEIDGVNPSELDGDVVLVSPDSRRAERLIRAASAHNNLLVTERCDQLCVMCSQPPKKTCRAILNASLSAQPIASGEAMS